MTTRPRSKTIAMLGIATASGASVRGCGMGPEALRVAGIAEALLDLGHSIEDHGDLRRQQAPVSTNPSSWRLPDERKTDVLTLAAQVSDVGAEILKTGRFPLFLGGDHSIAMGTVSAVARHCLPLQKPVHVIWIDAHADYNTPQTSPSGNLHGMPLALLCGEPGFDESFGGDWLGRIDPRNVTIFGARSVDRDERRLVQERGVDVVDMRRIDQLGVVASMQKVIEKAKTAGAHLHVSFDVDSLDPDIAPGGGTLVPGGLSYREAHLIMEMLHDSGVVGSLDVVELNPFLDHGGKSATLLVDLVASLFGRSIMGEEAGPMEFVSEDFLPEQVEIAEDKNRKPVARGELGPLYDLIRRGLPTYLDDKGAMDVRRLAHDIGVTHQAIYKWFDREKLPARRVSQIVRLSIEAHSVSGEAGQLGPNDFWSFIDQK